MSESIIHPLVEPLAAGMTVREVIDSLTENDCLTFPQLESGLFPAANFDNLNDDKTGMSDAWLRDSSCIGLALLSTGHSEAARRAVIGVINGLKSVKSDFDAVIELGFAPENYRARPPIRYTGQNSTPKYNWPNAQNDALGYSLQFIGMAVKRGAVVLNEEDAEIINRVVLYLKTIKYWQDTDSGHWEEVKKLNASSVGAVAAGLRSVREIVNDATMLESLIAKGQLALEEILPFESKTPSLERRYDSALIFLVEPNRVVDDEKAAQIISDAEDNLMAEQGFRRYLGDSYWGPDYRRHFEVRQRTADFSNPADMRLRDSYLTPGNEARWTLFDPLILMYYAHKYQKTGNQDEADKAREFLARALSRVVSHTTDDGRVVWRMPELFFLQDGEWVPNDHLGLLWAQANLLLGLQTYREVFGEDTVIKFI